MQTNHLQLAENMWVSLCNSVDQTDVITKEKKSVAPLHADSALFVFAHFHGDGVSQNAALWLVHWSAKQSSAATWGYLVLNLARTREILSSFLFFNVMLVCQSMYIFCFSFL